jgi:hypothetical protein
MFESTSPSPDHCSAHAAPKSARRAHAEDSHCDCAAHHAVAIRFPDARRGSLLAALLPLFVCAFCPACLTLWMPLLASVGLGFALPERVHSLGLGLAIAVALGPAAWHARRVRVWGPVLFVLAGASVFVATHAWGVGRLCECFGALSLVLGCFLERRARRVAAPAAGAFS